MSKQDRQLFDELAVQSKHGETQSNKLIRKKKKLLQSDPS